MNLCLRLRRGINVERDLPDPVGGNGRKIVWIDLAV
jgi:hypothetical protein